MLDGVNVALGVTGSIAAVRCVELIHELRRHGASVRVVVSESATNIVHPWALSFASDAPVVESLTGAVEHVELCGRDGWADVYAIAPATANTIGKLAGAIDDTPVTTCATTAIGAGVPLVVAPAMHEPMYDHPGVLDNLEGLQRDYGVTIADARIEEGKAKLASDTAILAAIARAAGDRPLADHRIAVTSGPTHEPIDPVRGLSTRASGRMGQAVAMALFARGAEVDLIRADDTSVPYATVRPAATASAMEQAALEAVDRGLDAYVSAAAIGDFAPTAADEKLPSGAPFTLELEPTPKVIASVREAAPSLPIVGFKAETASDDEALVAAARELLAEHDLSFVVANDAGVMGADDARILLVEADAETAISGSKAAIGATIADRLVDDLS